MIVFIAFSERHFPGGSEIRAARVEEPPAEIGSVFTFLPL
jgi:hypothetical protein